MSNRRISTRISASTDEDSDLLKDIGKTGENKSSKNIGNKVFTREEFEEHSRVKRVKKRKADSSEKNTEVTKDEPKSNVSSSRGILKNGSRRDYSYSFKMKKLAADMSSLEMPEELKNEGMKTNLEIDSWSVASFDTCSADVRRTYTKQFALRIGRWFTTAKSLAVFQNKQGLIFTVPPHEESDYEDDEPYGPHDPESSFYKRKMLERKSKKTSKMRRIKSFASTFSSRKSSADRSKSANGTGKTLRSRIRKSISKGSSKHSEGQSSVKLLMKKEPKSQPEGYVPPDMTWDPNFNNGKGGLVNKEPEFLPPNKIWSRTANGGKGGVINKPPQPHTIPPGLIWSRSAFNGQGGLVNCRPDEIPKGKMWDFEADNGMGALVDASESFLLRIAKQREEKEAARKRREQRKKRKKTKSQGRIRISNSRNELLKELNAENERIFAEIDAEEERQRVALEKKNKGITEDNQVKPPEKYVPKEDDDSVLLLDESEKKANLAIEEHHKRTNKKSSLRRPSFSERRKSLYSSAKSVISEGVKKIAKKKLKLKKTVLLAASEQPENKEKAKKLGIEEGLVVKMFETFEAMSLRTDDAVRESSSSSGSSSSGSTLL